MLFTAHIREVTLKEQSFQKPPVPIQGGLSGDRDLTQEPVLDLAAIQSDLLLGHSKKSEAHIYFEIIDRTTFANFLIGLPITSAADVYRLQDSKLAMFTGKQ